ncbi:MAG: hypothetical protein ABID84_04250 [Chloroflexota bacterium]
MHDQADMGGLGAALAQKTAALTGERRWAIHKETVHKFWGTVATYLRSFDPRHLKLYQDGLPIGGKMAWRVAEEAAQKGSKNYRLVLDLLHKGSELRQTEDPRLLLQEHENIRRSVQHESAGAERCSCSAQHYQLKADRLTSERDQVIAETINTTLKESEVGVLFIGADHDVVSRLQKDISVTAVKDPEQVMAYFEELFRGQDEKRLAALAENLTSPIILS